MRRGDGYEIKKGSEQCVAVSVAFGPAAALELVDALASEKPLASYHLLPSPRRPSRQARPLARRPGEFERAASLTKNTRERPLLLDRPAASARGRGPPG